MKRYGDLFLHMTATRADRRFSFTLIELLVVIGIIGLMVAIAAPALQKAKTTAKRVSCISNLKQIGLSVHAYAQSNNEWFPWNCTSQMSSYPERIPLPEALGLNSKIFKCPNENENLFETEGTSYIWNWMLIELPGNGRIGQNKYDTAPYGGLVGAESFPIMFDAGSYHGKKGNGNAVNVLFADGHVGGATGILP